MKVRTLVLIFILILAPQICIHLPLYADRGSIPFEENVQIFEPNQRAMIAWNGYEEILLLTTDLHASESTKVLEVIPLPSEPVVKEGDMEVFKKATDLINKHLQKQARLSRSRTKVKGKEAEEMEPAGEITFHEKIGAHDISVAHVLNSHGFIDWVDKYLKSAGVENPKIPEELKTVISEYLEEGFGWFVFDVVQLEKKPKTNEAIQYRFRTGFLYYPLKITRTEEGHTTIDLLILTPFSHHYNAGIPSEKIYESFPPIELTRKELSNLNNEMYELFMPPKKRKYRPFIFIWTIRDKLSSFKADLIVKGQKNVELMNAVEKGNMVTVKNLIDAGVAVNATKYEGSTALMSAAGSGHAEIVKLLLDVGAYVNARDRHGNTALTESMQNGHPEIAKLLIEEGANVNIRDNEGATALMLASQEGNTLIAKLLIEAGAEVNAKDKDGCTALMVASQYGYTEVAKLLIEGGADIDLRDKRGHIALWWAYQFGHTEVLQLIRKAM